MEFRTASELLAAMRGGAVSSAELTDQAIAAIEAGDGEVNAVVVRDFDRARSAAKAADAARAAGAERPLLGLPMTVKEAFNVAGLPTTWGLPGTSDIPILQDAVAVERLKAAGAVILGKTNIPVMLADWQSFNPVYGMTRNPWDLTRSPGGSSGGGAAALAAGYVSLEYGTDLGGSLRAPAAFCGVFTHRGSFGLVPTRGNAPPGTPQQAIGGAIDLAVIGPMARSVADLSLALDATAGPDAPHDLAYRLDLPPARHAALGDFRVLVLSEHPLLRTSADVLAALEARAQALESAGCAVGRARDLTPDLTVVAQTFVTLLMAIMAADGDPSAPGLYHRDWVQADRTRTAIHNQWRALFEAWDVVLCPTMPTTAFAHDQRPMNERRIMIDAVEAPYETQSLWTSISGLTGHPTTAMPIGLGADGLSIGAQIIGPMFEDRTTLAFAALMEREFGGFVRPPRLA